MNVSELRQIIAETVKATLDALAPPKPKPKPPARPQPAPPAELSELEKIQRHFDFLRSHSRGWRTWR